MTERRVELDDEELARLDEKFHILQEHLEEQPVVRFTYFKPDMRKEGGAYLTVFGVIRKIRDYEREILLQDETVIPVDDIVGMECPLFSSME